LYLVYVTTNCNDNNITTSGVYFLREYQRQKAVYCEVVTVGGNWLVSYIFPKFMLQYCFIVKVVLNLFSF